MMQGRYPGLLIIVLCLYLGILNSEKSFTKDTEIALEELVIEKHLKSLGKPEILAAIKSRSVEGTASAEFTGPFRLGPAYHSRKAVGSVTDGQSLIVSERGKLGIVMKFSETANYSGEYLAYDGHNATVAYFDGHNLGSFPHISKILEEGLLGGTLSLAWPLLEKESTEPKLKYKGEKKIEGTKLIELEYLSSKLRMDNLKIKLYFDPETFLHVMTEYSFERPISPMFNYEKRLFQELFDDYREVDGLMLPHKYTMSYSQNYGGGNSRWVIKAEHWLHNAHIDPQVYQPEPILGEEQYQQILEELRSISSITERNPSSFTSLDEGAIRDHFLQELNLQYERGATGEMFIASGETDILIRAKNKNVFIAELRFWTGPKAFDEAIDQLLSYLMWRDSKCVLLVFNKTGNSRAVRKKMHEVMESRAQHRKTLFYQPDGDSRYVLVKDAVPNQEISVTTQLYDLSTKK